MHLPTPFLGEEVKSQAVTSPNGTMVAQRFNRLEGQVAGNDKRDIRRRGGVSKNF